MPSREISPQEQQHLDKQLAKAVHKGDIAQIKLLADQGANLDMRTSGLFNSGHTLLERAILANDMVTLQALLDCGADPNARNAKGNTPLTLAAAQGRVSLIEALMAKGADIEATDKQGHTPYIAAAQKMKIEALHVLIAHGANIEARDYNGNSAYAVALWATYNDISDGGSERRPERMNTSFNFLREMRRLEAQTKAPAPAFSAPATDAEEVTLSRKTGGRVLEQIFNFASRERVTLVRAVADGPVEAVTLDDFAAIRDSDSLRAAFALHRKAGGTATEAEVFGDVITKPLHQPKI